VNNLVLYIGAARLLQPNSGSAHVRRRHRHHRCFLCAPGSNPGKTPDDHRAAQREPWWVARNPNKSLEFLLLEPNDIRTLLPLDRSSLPAGRVCSALVSNNRALGKTPDRQR
jgi:hypothetical protein